MWTRQKSGWLNSVSSGCCWLRDEVAGFAEAGAIAVVTAAAVADYS